MITAEAIQSFLTFNWLTGPILSKELRIAGRRRRNYVLRMAYLVLFTLILAMIWLQTVRYRSGNTIYDVARMSEISQSIAAFVVWFQFVCAQLIAIVLLSTAISDEIYNRTLGVLMTTPINSFQIVAGKLVSRIIQLLLLICLSMPVLAIIRIFGGIPWSFLMSSLCITLVAILFVGSISLFYSIFCRRAYVVIILAILTATFFFLFIPAITFITLEAFDVPKSIVNQNTVFQVLSAANPWFYLIVATEQLFSPVTRGGPQMASLLVHCLTMLSLSACVIALSISLVRRAALRQIAGGASPAPSVRKRRRNFLRPSGDAIATVRGSPIVWKEIRTPLFRRRRRRSLMLFLPALLVLALTYFLLQLDNALDDEGVQAAYIIIFGLFGMLFAISVPAGGISSEKESLSWPLLLTTTLGDWEILAGKAIGSLRRVVPCFLLLFLHLAFFVLVGYIHPVCLVQLPVPILGAVLFLTGSGLYFSARFRHTTTAVIANFLLAGTLWFLVPFLGAIIAGISHEWDLVEGTLSVNPLVQAIVVIAATVGRQNADRSIMSLDYDFPSSSASFLEATWRICLLAVACTFCGFLWAWLAKRRFRKDLV